MKSVTQLILKKGGFLVIAVVSIWCLAHTFDPPRLNWGDSASDYNVMITGKNFDTYGFLELKLTPHLFDSKFLTDRRYIYTHYPQLPDLMNGLLRRFLKLSEIGEFRIFALSLSVSSLFFIYQLIARYWNSRIAQLSCTLWVLNPLWIQHADYLHHYPYATFFGSMCLYYLTRFIDTKRVYFTCPATVALFLAYLASYDLWFFTPIMACFVILYHRHTMTSSQIALPCTTLLVALGGALLFKFGTNAWALGGVSELYNDLHFQYIERATDTVVQTSYMSGLQATLLGRIEHYFTFSVLAASIVNVILLLPFLRKRIAASHPNPLYLLIAAVPFLYVFTELLIGQHYPTLLVLPFYAISVGSVTWYLYTARSLIARVAAVALFSVSAVNSVYHNSTFERAFFDFDSIKTLNEKLAVLTTPHDKILINHVFDSFYRYYYTRDTVPMILNERGCAPIELRRNLTAAQIFVEHLDIHTQLFDKAYYYIFAKDQKWQWWGSPSRYRHEIDRYIKELNGELIECVRNNGELLFETKQFRIWKIR